MLATARPTAAFVAPPALWRRASSNAPTLIRASVRPHTGLLQLSRPPLLRSGRRQASALASDATGSSRITGSGVDRSSGGVGRERAVAGDVGTVPVSAGKAPKLITTPIYYVNDKPHIGHAYTSLACDALARW